MKKITMLSTVFAAMMLATAGTASAETHLLTKDVKLVKRDTKKVEVKINQPNVGVLDVVIKDIDGVVVHEGIFEVTQGVSTQLNLNALPNGEYVMSCSNDKFWSAQTLLIKNGNVEIDENSYKEAVLPKIEAIGVNRFEVSTSNKNVADMSVTITDLAGTTIYNSYLSAGSRFNLNHLPAGEYGFEFTVADRFFKKYVKVK